MKIVADRREKLIPDLLIGLGVDVEVKELESADYVLPSFLVERKRVSDLLNSIKSGRIFSQLAKCGEVAKRDNLTPLLLIEGAVREIERRGMVNAVCGLLLILQFSSFKILFSPSPLSTAAILKMLLNYEKRLLKEKPRVVRVEDERITVLCAFPGIGVKRARKLLSHFGSLSKIFESSEEELEKVIPKNVAKRMKRILIQSPL